MPLQRLDRFISNQLCLSRKEVKDGIRRGAAAVNGKTVTRAEYSVETLSDEVVFNGQAVLFKEHIYIVMNKPAGVLSASEDKSCKTVIDLIPQSLRRRGLFPVGRLDKDTTGLLIITDDGDFAHNVLSPKKEIYKTYIAGLDGDVNEEMIKKFADGIVLADGTRCRSAFLKPIGDKTVEIKICEGKFHQIKRMLGTVDLGVNSLKRVAIGEYKLPEELLEGMCKETTKFQLNALFIGK